MRCPFRSVHFGVSVCLRRQTERRDQFGRVLLFGDKPLYRSKGSCSARLRHSLSFRCARSQHSSTSVSHGRAESKKSDRRRRSRWRPLKSLCPSERRPVECNGSNTTAATPRDSMTRNMGGLLAIAQRTGFMTTPVGSRRAISPHS